MTRAILVNDKYDYVAYDHPKETNEHNFDTVPHATIGVLLKADSKMFNGATLYLWRFPCYECAKAIVYAGIHKLVYRMDDELDPTRTEAQLLLEHSDVEIIQNPNITL